MPELDNKVAIVSGGARGMGASHVRSMVSAGARVMLTDRRTDDAAALVEELGGALFCMEADVIDAGHWAAVVDRAEDVFGPPNVLVNNAEIPAMDRADETSEDTYRRIAEVDQLGVFLGMRAVIPAMRRAGGGSIVNIGSTAAMVSIPGCFAYSAAKWAVRGMTKAAAAELALSGIRVNAVRPRPDGRDLRRCPVPRVRRVVLRHWRRSGRRRRLYRDLRLLVRMLLCTGNQNRVRRPRRPPAAQGRPRDRSPGSRDAVRAAATIRRFRHLDRIRLRLPPPLRCAPSRSSSSVKPTARRQLCPQSSSPPFSPRDPSTAAMSHLLSTRHCPKSVLNPVASCTPFTKRTTTPSCSSRSGPPARSSKPMATAPPSPRSTEPSTGSWKSLPRS